VKTSVCHIGLRAVIQGMVVGVVGGLAVASGAALARGSVNSANSHGARRTTHVLGFSVERRPIVAFEIGVVRARCSMLVVGSIAGDEPGGITVTNALASFGPIDGVTLWLIPDLNPDGAVRGTRVNADRVDLNRNSPFRWRRIGEPGSRYYSGARAASEPESRAIEAFIRRERPGLAVWLHQPYGLIDDSQGPWWAERLLAPAFRLPLERLVDYPGSAIGWEDHVLPGTAFDVELPGGHLSAAMARFYANGIRSLAHRFARRQLCLP
jgi:murein peptide amidase A